ncbi:MAG: hypothetical protein LBT01_04510 [Spirochaetaceae bacterium]|jgi:hypothetical protein|nr:hypothetical protein [Spirochaetaceae bacterium]
MISRIFFLLLCPLFALVSCATGPKQIKELDSTEKNFALFSADASVYLAIDTVDTVQTRALVDTVISSFSTLDDKRQKQILDKTKTIYMALYNDDDDGQKNRWTAMLRGGGYPALTSALGLSLSSGWKKIKDPAWGDYWQSASGDINLAIGQEAVIISTGALQTNESAAQVPQAFLEFQNGAAISGWLPSVGFLQTFLSSSGIPIQVPAKEILFAMRPASGLGDEGGVYETSFRLEMQNASAAKGIAAMLAFARMGGTPRLAPQLQMLYDIFFAATPRVEGSALLLDGGTMSADQITRLILFFSLQ